MRTNRLAIREAESGSSRERLTALEWAGEALERGNQKRFEQWMNEARRIGEAGPPRYVHWDGEGRKVTIKTFAPQA